MFTVSFFSLSLQTSEVRTFPSLRGARRWAGFLSSQSWASQVTIWKGIQPGGERV